MYIHIYITVTENVKVGYLSCKVSVILITSFKILGKDVSERRYIE